MNKKIRSYFEEISHDEYWKKMTRFADKKQIIDTLEALHHALERAELRSDMDLWFLLGEASELAFYHLYLSSDKNLQHKAYKVATALVRSNGTNRVRFARDLYIAALRSDSKDRIKEAVFAISTHEEMASLVLDSAIYDLYGNIDRFNVGLITKMIYHLRHDKGMLNAMSGELVSLFTVIDQIGDVLNDHMALELFRLTNKPLFLTLGGDDEE